ncbi:hypothetical protein [Urbifossiella limnaea]|uniref:hypothetical protein n=1 Tax=Urbifossiella limnaea TaxID=2528023 RepID=UPI0011A96679|nr:hypothetical protein [Urbifossiella limnaea]
MSHYTVACASCGLRWQKPGSLSAYEGQSVESRPCPSCGAYTLGCAEVRPAARGRRSAERPRRAAA